MQRPRFNFRRLRDVRVQDLRERVSRIRQIQQLGSQVTRLRQRPFRGEYLVPIAALLLLVLALILSRAPSGSIIPDASRSTVVAQGSGARGTATARVGGSGYPGGTPSPTRTFVSGSSQSATPGLSAGLTAYPGPGGIGGPMPIGTPVAGGLVPGGDMAPTPGGFAPTPSFGTPGIVTPVAGSSTAVAGVGRMPGSGYPSSSGSSGSYNPNPGSQPGPALIPTTAPVAPPFVPPVQSGRPPVFQRQPTARPRIVPSYPQPTAVPPSSNPGGGAGYPSSGFPAAQPTPTANVTSAQPPASGGVAPTPAVPRSTAVAPGAPVAPSAPAGGQTPSAAPTAPSLPTATPAPPTATTKPVTRLEGNVRWLTSQSPIVLDRDVLVPAGSSLQIDPGVEVRARPGIDILIDGTLRTAGTAGAPVRFSGGEGRWNSIAGRAGSFVTLEHTELRNAGSGGVGVSTSGGQLTMRDVLLTDSGGGISSSGSAVDIRGTRIFGNDLRSGPALSLELAKDMPATLQNNIVGGNQVARGTPQIRLIAGPSGSGPIAIENNAFIGSDSPIVIIQTSAPLGGTIRCNGLRDGTIGLQLSATTASGKDFSLVVDNNAFEQQTTYGVASTVSLDAGGNWWGHPSGPFDAQRNPQGQGARVGVNVGFQPPLPARPACAPIP